MLVHVQPLEEKKDVMEEKEEKVVRVMESDGDDGAEKKEKEDLNKAVSKEKKADIKEKEKNDTPKAEKKKVEKEKKGKKEKTVEKKGRSHPHKCSFCPSSYPDKINLNKHIGARHYKQLVYKCTFKQRDTCTRRFVDRESYQKHMAEHVKLMPFRCAECDHSFGTQLGLDVHQRTHKN